jgi:molybdenum-dependent DNA-binding transcriptional regulator ModE
MSEAGEKKRGRSGKILPTEYTVDEYLWAAEQVGGLHDLARFMDMSYSSMWDHLHRIDLMAEVRNLMPEEAGKPGPRTVPKLLSVDGTEATRTHDALSIRQEAQRRYEEKKKRALRKRDQHIRFDSGPIAMIFLGDQHFGNAGTDTQRAFDEQETILNTPGAYCWQMGDLVDNFIVGRLMAENMKPSTPVAEQWVLAEDYLYGFKDKLLAYCGGNHGAWTLKVSGIDYRRDITPQGVLYDGDRLDATVHVGEASYRITSRHKWRGSSIYNPTHAQERGAFKDDPNFDIYVGAHVHRGAISREFIHNRQRKISVLTGTYKTFDDYALQEGFESNDASTGVAVVMHEDGSFFGTSNLKACLHYMRSLYGE